MKRTIAAVMAAIFAAVTIMTVAVFAENGTVTLNQISYADEGGTFKVEVYLSGNPGIRNISCNIRFDYTDIDFVSVDDAKLLSGFLYADLGSTVQLQWTGGKKDVEKNGLLATITFKALKAPEGGSVVYNSVSAHSGNGVAAPVDGVTSLLYFGSDRNNESTAAPEPDNGPDVTTSAEETEPVTSEEEEEEEIEDIPDETNVTEVTEPVTTTTEATTTKSTTTKATTTKSTTTKATTTTPEPATTPEPTTTPEPETTPAPETTPEPETEPTEAMTEEIVPEEPTPEESVPAFADAVGHDVDNSTANRGTLLIAVLAIALTAVVVAAIEIYKRGR